MLDQEPREVVGGEVPERVRKWSEVNRGRSVDKGVGGEGDDVEGCGVDVSDRQVVVGGGEPWRWGLLEKSSGERWERVSVGAATGQTVHMGVGEGEGAPSPKGVGGRVD